MFTHRQNPRRKELRTATSHFHRILLAKTTRKFKGRGNKQTHSVIGRAAKSHGPGHRERWRTGASVASNLPNNVRVPSVPAGLHPRCARRSPASERPSAGFLPFSATWESSLRLKDGKNPVSMGGGRGVHHGWEEGFGFWLHREGFKTNRTWGLQAQGTGLRPHLLCLCPTPKTGAQA